MDNYRFRSGRVRVRVRVRYNWSIADLNQIADLNLTPCICYLVTMDHPRSLRCDWTSVLKLCVNRNYNFQEHGDLKILQIWLKRLFLPLKFVFWVFTPKHYFSSSKPPKGTSLGESASFKVYIVKICPPFLLWREKREGKERKGTQSLKFK